MFMDGLQYAAVSKNLAHGEGSFWRPHLSDTWNKSGNQAFLEHPPLVFGIQSLFFRLLGDSRFVERSYSFLTALITALLIILIWRLIYLNNKNIKETEWLPVMFWILVPVCFWSYQNNMQENTMGVFTLGAVYFELKALLKQRQKHFNLILAAIFITLAFFSKGFPGLFPLVLIPLYFIVFKQHGIRLTFLYTAEILLITLACIFLIVLTNPAATESMKFWLNERFLSRISGETTTGNRFDVFWRIFTELMLPLILTVGILFTDRSKWKENLSISGRNALFFVLLGLSATVPTVFTMVQKGFYLVPGFPLFAIGLASLSAPALAVALQKLNTSSLAFKWLRILSIALLPASIIFSVSQIGKVSRDKEILHDVYILGDIITPHTTVGADISLYTNWPFQLYLLRYFDISTEPTETGSPEYFISPKENKLSVPPGFQKIEIKTIKVNLYKKKKPEETPG
jgi:4-amino-4-deoxy-L-arabinose transferase-like glycosyltransferase